MEILPSCGSLAASGVAHLRCGQPLLGLCPARAAGRGLVPPSSPWQCFTQAQEPGLAETAWEPGTAELEKNALPTQPSLSSSLPAALLPCPALPWGAAVHSLVLGGMDTPELQGMQWDAMGIPWPGPSAHRSPLPPDFGDRVL